MNVCVIGVGNIGLRYVQGIGKTFPDAELFLVDKPERLAELADQLTGNIHLISSVDELKTPVDLFVVATSCEPRLALYKKCLERNPRFVILDKYLFASRQEFDDCLSLDRVPTFVNQWMYGSKTFDCLFEQPATSVELTGSGWGLACNAVHWIDVFKRHLEIGQLRVGEGTSISEVFPAKRAGYEEISGKLVFVATDCDRSITLIDQPEVNIDAGMNIRVDDRDYLFNYSEIICDGVVLSRFPYFSEQIGGIVADIMSSGRCTLPVLEESISQHLLIEDVLATLDRRPRVT